MIRRTLFCGRRSRENTNVWIRERGELAVVVVVFLAVVG